MKIDIQENATAQARVVAKDLADFIRANPDALLCLAAGDTPLAAYRELVEMQKRDEVKLNSVYYVGLDEWVGLGAETIGSCKQVMNEAIYAPAGIREERMVVFDGLAQDVDAELKRVEAWIDKRGGIDYTVLGMGMNGHVGFNEPNTGLSDGCIRVTLDSVTRKVSKKYFNAPQDVEYGVSVGAGALKKARRVVLMASGTHKAQIVKRLIDGPATPEIPVTLFADHPNVMLSLDRAAAGENA